MKKLLLCMFVIFYILLCNSEITVFAQSTKKKEKFSHTGVKAALGTGSFNMTSERELQEGEGSSLNLGYGFTDKFSLWLTLIGSEHLQKDTAQAKVKFSGLELNIQHKFETNAKLQPYGKVGFGIYGLNNQESNITLIGAGINVAVGLDYFFSKHFGIGAELLYKKLDYFQENKKVESGELLTDLNPDLNGDTVGVLLTITIQ